ncbi:hypothetical protein M433DRAFT_154938 [Acidomyces richmondensis BFW]|nr:MAG: hypothetical protein FE78DRAFT_91405 [Acidomyces sp. 'richmondensis']KYG45050.1 hypothetical protein M433DRAFT_154938 [Acidomyces richmondensis BFW]
MNVETSSPTRDENVQQEATTLTRGRHQCYLCNRTYERQDHLSRHLKSHSDQRSYRCLECGKGFNRADLLNRHRAAHAKNTGDTLRRRTARACEPCIKAKTRCDEDRPCKRCKSKNTACQDTEERRLSLPIQATDAGTGTGEDTSLITSEPESHRIPCAANLASHGDASCLEFHSDAYVPPPQTAYSKSICQPRNEIEEASLLLGLNGSTVDRTALTTINHDYRSFDPNSGVAHSFQDFFEQVMLPEAEFFGQNTIMPPDVSNFTQDLTFDSIDFDFSFLASGLTRPPTAQGDRMIEGEGAFPFETTKSDVQRRSEAFTRSPWSWNHWVPERNWHAFSGQEEINVQEDRVSACDQLTSPCSQRLVHCELDNTSRDRMIRTVTRIANDRLAIPSFPSLELLEDLIDIYLLQDSNGIESYIHASSFNCKETRTELLLSMVASGAQYIALSPVWKMGLVMQEVVRLALADLFERDNSMTRELQILESYSMWLEIGIFSGFRRKTEIALSFLQPLVTMLTWGGAFKRQRYEKDMEPKTEDTDDVLNMKWKTWAELEALKRLVIHVFLHDSMAAIANMKNPLLSASQMHIPLPATRELWLAPNAEAWRNSYMKLKPLSQREIPSMCDFFAHNQMLDNMNFVDKPLCLLAACHGLGHEIWNFRQSSRLLVNWKNERRRDRWLANQTTQRDLMDDLSTVQAHCEIQTESPAEILLTLELLMMSLHVDLEDIQTFSGKAGEEEARKIFPRLRNWAQEAESRTAVRHAAQVFRIALNFEKTKLRDFYAISLYHAALTLWVYGMVTSNLARRSGTETPVLPNFSKAQRQGSISSQTTTANIFLDAADDRAAKAFTLLGQGTPGIQNLQGIFVPLSSSRGIMTVAESLLRRNFPHSQNGLPPLVENLANLMNELGKLSGKE